MSQLGVDTAQCRCHGLPADGFAVAIELAKSNAYYGGWAAEASAPIDAVAEIKALRILSGPYAGGYELAPNGRLNWYFANLGLLPLVPMLSAADLQTYILPYLNLYLASTDPAVEPAYSFEDCAALIGP
mgnify:CR=1 FL=1